MSILLLLHAQEKRNLRCTHHDVSIHSLCTMTYIHSLSAVYSTHAGSKHNIMAILLDYNLLYVYIEGF